MDDREPTGNFLKISGMSFRRLPKNVVRKSGTSVGNSRLEEKVDSDANHT